MADTPLVPSPAATTPKTAAFASGAITTLTAAYAGAGTEIAGLPNAPYIMTIAGVVLILAVMAIRYFATPGGAVAQAAAQVDLTALETKLASLTQQFEATRQSHSAIQNDVVTFAAAADEALKSATAAQDTASVAVTQVSTANATAANVSDMLATRVSKVESRMAVGEKQVLDLQSHLNATINSLDESAFTKKG